MENRPHSPARQALNDKRLQRTAFAYFSRDYDDCDSEEQRIIYDFVMLEDALCDLIYAEHYVDEVIEELRPEPPVDQSTPEATLSKMRVPLSDIPDGGLFRHAFDGVDWVRKGSAVRSFANPDHTIGVPNWNTLVWRVYPADQSTDEQRDATLAAGGTWCTICRGPVRKDHSHG